MARVRRGPKARVRRKKVLKLAKGNRGARSKLFRTAVEAVHKNLTYAYKGRRLKKRDYRGLWINRIGAALRSLGVSYSAFIGNLKKSGIELNRKILAELAISDPKTFEVIVNTAKA